MVEHLKQSRGKDRWNTESSQPNTEATGGVNIELIPISASGKQQVQEEQGREEDLNQV